MSTPSAAENFDRLTKAERFTIGSLCFVNILNYMDRYTLTGVLIHIQADFSIGDDLAGLLQTGFIFSYMIISPLFGYLGDRYSRRLLLIICIAFWTLMTIFGSLAPSYPMFFATRALVGAGEAGFTTIAPSVISDIVAKDARSMALAFFYTAIPLGAGLGYLVGAKIAQWTGTWRWGLRATPILGGLSVLFVYFGVDPIRGEKEAAAIGGQPAPTTSYKDDLRYLFKNRSFVLSTSASVCVCFIAGTLGWWAPKCLYYGFVLIAGNAEDVELATVFLQFGLITAFTGLLGVSVGSFLSKYLRRFWPSVDPIVCAVGLLISLPCIVGAIAWCSRSKSLTFGCLIIGQFALNLNWAIVIDILLYIVTAQRRASAAAIQMLLSHALGDCFSPYIVGLLSEKYKKEDSFTFYQEINGISFYAEPQIVYALQKSLLTVMGTLFIGAMLFLITARYVEWDRIQAEKLAVLT